MKISDFDYELPAELVAQTPREQRSESRLLIAAGNKPLEDRAFRDLPQYLRAGDLLVFNDSKVIPARLNGHKETGGAIEIFVEKILDKHTARVMLRASKKPRTGATVTLLKPASALAQRPAEIRPELGRVKIMDRDPKYDDRFLVKFAAPVSDILDLFGEIPLPPYISHSPTSSDAERYQTVYARHPGSAAAPTAGLHFDHDLLNVLLDIGVGLAYVTLHVGSGTFAPVRCENIEQHRMHAEWCSIDGDTAQKIVTTKSQGGRIIAVGTTSLRTLESAANQSDSFCENKLAGSWETNLFITPGYEFKLIDGLITNFHLPRSTLLMLVSAFAGLPRVRQIYSHAIEREYRFFSYGDAMLLV